MDYIISVNFEDTFIEIEVEEGERAIKWKQTYSAKEIENLTQRAKNPKSFKVFSKMLQNALDQVSESVMVNIFTPGNLAVLRSIQGPQSSANTSMMRGQSQNQSKR